MSIINRRKIQPYELQVVARHIEQFPARYGADLSSNSNLETLRSLLSEHAVHSLLIEHGEAGTELAENDIVGSGICAFIDIKTANTLLHKPPSLDLGEHLYELERQGRGVLLRPSELANHNKGEGVVLVFLHFSAPAGAPGNPETKKSVILMQLSFRHIFAGHHCKMAFHPIPFGYPKAAEPLIGQGFRQPGPDHNFMVFDLADLDKAPFHLLAYLSRTQAPKLCFSNSEKDLLLEALLGRSDADIAKDQHVSLETVRKRWRHIFQRVEDHPDIKLFEPTKAALESKRGKEKRSVILNYIDAHLEEIRP